MTPVVAAQMAASQVDRMTTGMMLGASVLVATQVLVVVVAIVWYRRSTRSDESGGPAPGSSR